MVHAFTSAMLVLAAQAAAPAPLPPLSMEQETSLKCGVAFGIISQWQKTGSGEGAKYPPIAERGREFFVRTTAQLMEDTGADRAMVGAWVREASEDFVADKASLTAIMPGCLLLLDASGL